MKRAALGLALLLALCVWRITPALAEPSVVVHKIRDGDTLPILAAEYYGDRKLAVFIMAMNDMEHPRALKPGERIKIPTSFKAYATAGETLEALAERYLEDRRRAPFLAEFNGLPRSTTLAEGQEVTIPFHIIHSAKGNESLRLLAATYYGDTNKWKMLKEYNFRESDRALNAGETIIIPISDVRIQDTKLPALDPEQAVRERRRTQMEERATKALPQARQAWDAGEYSTVKRELAEIDVDYLSPQTAADVAFLLGSAYVAFGDEESARAQFKKVLVRQPEFSVRADITSPKITKVWESAGGAVIRP